MWATSLQREVLREGIPGVYKCLHTHTGFPGGSVVKNPSANAGDMGSILGLGRSPEEGNGNPLQYSVHGKFHGQRCLVSYNPRGHKRVRHD